MSTDPYVLGPIRNRNPTWLPPTWREDPSKLWHLRRNAILGLLRSPPDQPLNLFTGYHSLVYVCIFTAGFSYAY